MVSPGFSSVVLQEMMGQGFADVELAKITGLSLARLKSVLTERTGLSDRQLDLLEKAAGTTAGELAAQHLEPQGGPFTELAATLADCRSRPLPRRRPVRKRSG